jgi:hypothetical protein
MTTSSLGRGPRGARSRRKALVGNPGQAVTKASVRPNRRVLSRESTRESGLDRTLQFVAQQASGLRRLPHESSRPLRPMPTVWAPLVRTKKGSEDVPKRIDHRTLPGSESGRWFYPRRDILGVGWLAPAAERRQPWLYLSER